MKIYTKTGDSGDTGLLAPGRVRKDHPRIEAYGTVDELNAALGLARASGLGEDIDRVIGRAQNELFSLGAQLAAVDPRSAPDSAISSDHVGALERDIDHLGRSLPPLTQFILPGGSASAAALHVARTVCRRAERRVVSLRDREHQAVSEILIQYLNRLSDLLFVAARAANHHRGVGDEVWSKGPPPTNS
jgi:cob(I)alamin adenosyltransferase